MKSGDRLPTLLVILLTGLRWLWRELILVHIPMQTEDTFSAGCGPESTIFIFHT